MPFVRAKRYPQKCPKCGFQWMSYKPNPKECPSCHRYLKKSTKKPAKPSYFCPVCGRQHIEGSKIYKEHLRYKRGGDVKKKP